MRIAYLDTIAGISGDMALGAFLDAGVSLDNLIGELAKLRLGGFELTAQHIERNSISAIKADVVISEAPKYHRHLADIHAIIDKSDLGASIKERAKKIFSEVAIAEARVHNSTIEKIHFHEVGAIDSLVDIVGTAICLEELKIDRVYSSPVKVGSGGTVNTQHGPMPVPTPATLEILKGYPVVLTDIPFELTTPTGAAIIKALSSGTLSTEQISVERIGYGSGSRDIPQIPNLLRLVVGEYQSSFDRDSVVSIETNVDDMNPEILPYVVEKLLNAGALDAYMTPVVMKKGRPGILLTVLTEETKMDAMLALLFRETTTLGVRIHRLERRKLPRGQRRLDTSLGPVMAKAVVIDGQEILVPEFEECKRLAKEKSLPLREIYRILESEFRQ